MYCSRLIGGSGKNKQGSNQVDPGQNLQTNGWGAVTRQWEKLLALRILYPVANEDASFVLPGSKLRDQKNTKQLKSSSQERRVCGFRLSAAIQGEKLTQRETPQRDP